MSRARALLAWCCAVLLRHVRVGAQVGGVGSGCTGPPEEDCAGPFGCCSSVAFGNIKWKLDAWAARDENPQTLLNMVATAYPVGKNLSLADVASFPLSSEIIQGKPNSFYLTLVVDRISRIDQKAQSFEMQYTLAWAWQDCRLLHNCYQIDLNENHVKWRHFWSPLLNIKERTQEDVNMQAGRHAILGNGLDLYTEDHVSSFRCAFTYENLPFDEQTCNLTISIKGTSVQTAILKWAKDAAISRVLSTEEWEIDKAPDWRFYAVTEKPLLQYLPEESQLIAQFKIRRKPAFLIREFVLPSIVFAFLSYMGLWVDIHAVPARAAFATLPVLVQSNKMSALSRVIPPISYTTRLTSFLDVTLNFMAVHAAVFGLATFATRRVQAYNTRRLGGKMRVWERIEMALVIWIENYLEVHMRWASPLLYFICSCYLLLG